MGRAPRQKPTLCCRRPSVRREEAATPPPSWCVAALRKHSIKKQKGWGGGDDENTSWHQRVSGVGALGACCLFTTTNHCSKRVSSTGVATAQRNALRAASWLSLACSIHTQRAWSSPVPATAAATERRRAVAVAAAPGVGRGPVPAAAPPPPAPTRLQPWHVRPLGHDLRSSTPAHASPRVLTSQTTSARVGQTWPVLATGDWFVTARGEGEMCQVHTRRHTFHSCTKPRGAPGRQLLPWSMGGCAACWCRAPSTIPKQQQQQQPSRSRPTP